MKSKQRRSSQEEDSKHSLERASMAPHMHPDDPSRMAVPYPYMPMNSNGVMAGHMFNWGGGGAGGNSAFQVRCVGVLSTPLP
ncbi:MAG: hypothetical protein ACPIOQ_64660 [Promethearchaeia archaeon]